MSRGGFLKRAALAVLFASMVAMGVAYGSAILSGGTANWSAWVLAVATSFAMVATMVLGAARPSRPLGGIGRLLVPFLAVLLILLGAFAAAFLLPSTGEPLLLGLPRRAAIVLYGIGILPALVLPLAYALTFDDSLTEDAIERVREAARKVEGQP